MNHLKCSDVQFAKLLGRTLAEYEEFKSKLLGGGDAQQP